MTTMTINFAEKISEVLNGFDFDKVHAYMTLTKWQWQNHISGELETPTIDQLRFTASDMLYRVIENGQTCVGTGGFYAYRFPYGVKLTFEPFNSSSY